MKRTTRTLSIVAGALLALAGLAACGPEAAPALPTRTPAPTFTPTTEVAQQPLDPAAIAAAQTAAAEQQPAPADPNAQPAPVDPNAQATPAAADPNAQPAPAEAATPEPSPTPAAAQVTASDVLNVRGGPGTNYNIIGSLTAGQTMRVTGKNQAGDWWQIDYNGQAGWVFGQLVSTQNTEAVAVAQNIPAPPPTPIPQPTQPPAPQPAPTQPPAEQPAEPAPTAAPSKRYEFNIAVLQKCEPNAGVTYVEGTVYKGGQPVSGNMVAFSYAPDGPVVAQIQAGPHPGYPVWRAGFYSHIIQHNGPREGNWFFWIVDGAGNRISEVANVHTDGTAGDGKCQQAVIDFDSR